MRGGGAAPPPERVYIFQLPANAWVRVCREPAGWARGCGFPARPSARELAPGAPTRGRLGAVVSLACVRLVQDPAGRVPPLGRKPPFSPQKCTLGLEMVIFRKNSAFDLKSAIFTKNRFWGKKGLRGDSGAEKVWFPLGFTRGWRGMTRKRRNQRET